MDDSRYSDPTQQFAGICGGNERERNSGDNSTVSSPSASGQSTFCCQETASSSEYQGDALQKHSIYPPGLEFLVPISNLLIDQKIQKWQSSFSFHRKNNYRILNEKDEQVYEAGEDSKIDIFKLGAAQVFTIKIVDKYDREAMRIQRSFAWFKNKIDVFNENILLGTVNQKMFTLKPHFQVRDPVGNVMYKIIVPLLMWQTSCSFKIVRPSEDTIQIGEIKKEFTNWRRELTTNADVFNINFPVDIDVKHKALLLAAVLFIDIVYFEGSRSSNYH